MESLWEWGSHFRDSFAVFLDIWPVHGQLVCSNLIHLPFLNVKTKTDLQYPNQTSALVWFYRTGSKIHNNSPIHYMRCTVVPCLKLKTTLAPEYVSYPKPSLIFCHMTVGYSWVTYGHIHSSQTSPLEQPHGGCGGSLSSPWRFQGFGCFPEKHVSLLLSLLG